MDETEMKLDQSLDDIIAGNNAAPARGEGGGGPSAATCYGCGGTGHFKRDCPSAPARGGGGGGGRRPYGTRGCLIYSGGERVRERARERGDLSLSQAAFLMGMPSVPPQNKS